MNADNNKIERVFFSFHDKICKFALRYSNHRVRSFIENLVLFCGVLSFSTVILCHRTFVYRGGAIKSEAVSMNGLSIPSMCLRNIEKFQYNVDVTHIAIEDSDAKSKSYIYNRIRHDFNQSSELQNETCLDDPQQNFLSTVAEHEIDPSSLLNISLSFSETKGFLFLEPSSLPYRNISSQHVVITTGDSTCFSNDPILRYVAKSSTGILNTIALNWILGAKNGTNGFIYQRQTEDLIELEGYLARYSFRWPTKTSYSSNGGDTTTLNHENIENDLRRKEKYYTPTLRWHHNYLIFKAGVLISTLFLFFLTTTLVSFTLRETQDRMLYFTYQLNLHIRRRMPYSNLILSHVIENMVFVPIMIGTIFFLMDCFYNGDKVLAFIVLSGVWICEVFSAISMRTIQSSIYFPKVFFQLLHSIPCLLFFMSIWLFLCSFNLHSSFPSTWNAIFLEPLRISRYSLWPSSKR